MAEYDGAITVFSPDGHLYQVEYANQCANNGPAVVGVCGDSAVVIGIEMKAVSKLQDERTVNRISQLDDHVAFAYSGSPADARILTSMARTECQNYKLLCEDQASVFYITRFIAQTLQKYTQSNGRRPFGLSGFIVGIDYDGTPHLYRTDASGTYTRWKAGSLGENAATVQEFLAQEYSTEVAASDRETIKLVLMALRVVIPTSSGFRAEVLVKCHGEPFKMLAVDEIESYIKEINAELDEKENPEISEEEENQERSESVTRVNAM